MKFPMALWLGIIVFGPSAYDRLMLWQADTTTVRLYNPDKGVLGSGVVLGRRDTTEGCLLLVATARHIVGEQDTGIALSELTGPVARVVARAPSYDTAAAEFLLPGLCGALPYRAAQLSRWPAVRGDKVFGSGYPAGVRFFGWGVTVDTNVPVTIGEDEHFLTAVNYVAGPGHSGGPIYDGYGSVVGLLSAISTSVPSLAVFAPVAHIQAAIRLVPGWEL